MKNAAFTFFTWIYNSWSELASIFVKSSQFHQIFFHNHKPKSLKTTQNHKITLLIYPFSATYLTYKKHPILTTPTQHYIVRTPDHQILAISRPFNELNQAKEYVDLLTLTPIS